MRCCSIVFIQVPILSFPVLFLSVWRAHTHSHTLTRSLSHTRCRLPGLPLSHCAPQLTAACSTPNQPPTHHPTPTQQPPLHTHHHTQIGLATVNSSSTINSSSSTRCARPLSHSLGHRVPGVTACGPDASLRRH